MSDIHSAPGRAPRRPAKRRRLLEQLTLAERMASVGTVAAGVAHEINNPLTFVLTNLALAQETLLERRAAPELEELLAEARQGAERVRDIVADLHVFGRGSTGGRARSSWVRSSIRRSP